MQPRAYEVLSCTLNMQNERKVRLRLKNEINISDNLEWTGRTNERRMLSLQHWSYFEVRWIKRSPLSHHNESRTVCLQKAAATQFAFFVDPRRSWWFRGMSDSSHFDLGWSVSSAGLECMLENLQVAHLDVFCVPSSVHNAAGVSHSLLYMLKLLVIT